MSGKRIATYVLLLLAVLAVYVFVRQVAMVLAAALVATAVAWWVNRDPGEAAPARRGDAGVALPGWLAALRGLAGLNARARAAACPSEVVTRVESVIDALRRLVPELNTRYERNRLTSAVNHAATDYLVRVVEPYCALPPAARQTNAGALVRDLAGLEAELSEVEALVAAADVREFKAKAASLSRRMEDPA